MIDMDTPTQEVHGTLELHSHGNLRGSVTLEE